MDNFRPIRLAQPRKAMFRHAGMAKAVSLEQGPVDLCVLGVNVKNPRAKFMDVRHRINELAHQMAGVPLDAKILAFALVEKTFPHGGLPEDVVRSEEHTSE